MVQDTLHNSVCSLPKKLDISHACEASYGGPANFSGRLNQVASKWNGTGELEFMNEWCVQTVFALCILILLCRTYKLGEEGMLMRNHSILVC
jgi:hypothetical protein